MPSCFENFGLDVGVFIELSGTINLSTCWAPVPRTLSLPQTRAPWTAAPYQGLAQGCFTQFFCPPFFFYPPPLISCWLASQLYPTPDQLPLYIYFFSIPLVLNLPFLLHTETHLAHSGHLMLKPHGVALHCGSVCGYSEMFM